MVKLPYFPLLAAWFLAFPASAIPSSTVLARCSKAVRGLLGRPSGKVVPAATPVGKIRDFDGLLQAFGQGFVPNLADSSQRHAFEIYRRMKLGDPNTNLNANSVDELASLLKKHPELKKGPFRNFHVQLREKSYPVSKELSAFLKSQTRNAGQIRGNLFQVDANRGFWKKVLGYREPEDLRGHPQKRREHFARFLDQRFPRDLRSGLANKKTSLKEKSKKLYAYLKEERRRLLEAGGDVAPISQAMVDVIHTLGFGDAKTIKALKSSDGLERLNAFRAVLQTRDSFAMELGFDGHFKHALKELGISSPSSLSGMDVWKRLQSLEDHTTRNAQTAHARSFKKVRYLSLVEAPFRSCLGGSDCSSREYFSKALDPNYHYFTLTDEGGHSSGHVTVVLGEAKTGGQKVGVAFVDKVQNVANRDIPLLLEGVRRSVEEKGYKLALPEDMGDHNGISNDADTGRWIKENLPVDGQESLRHFRPHAHAYNFPPGYSRAQKKLASRRVLPVTSQDWEMVVGELDTAWKVESLNLEGLVQSSISLKHGGVEDKLRYISSMDAIDHAGLTGDPDFASTLRSWLGDGEQEFKLRKQVVLYWWPKKGEELSSLLENFDLKERVVLVQNVLDTPRYKKILLEKKGKLPALMLQVAGNKKLREELTQIYSARHGEVMARVLQVEDISPDAKIAALKSIKENFGSRSVEKLSGIAQIFEGSSLENWMEGELARNFVGGIPSDAALGRELGLALDSKDALVSNFARRIISRERTPITGVYSELLESGAGSVGSAAGIWIPRRGVDARLKAQFLMGQIGSREGNFEHYLKRIPESERAAVWEEIDRETSFRVFRRLARESGMSKELFDRGALETFEFRRRGFPDGTVEGQKVFRMGDAGEREVTLIKAFEMQASPVTHLQYYLAMGENPSRFVDEGQRVGFGGKRVDSNRPVEYMSWHHAQALGEKLTQLQDDYIYELPTEAEWEFAARGGTNTRYWFGDSEGDVELYGWFSKNSNGKTHPIGHFPPNPLGLYEMNGNVWEWTGDWYGRLSTQSVVDPTGPSSGSNRVIRGGSWGSNAWILRSALRNYGFPGSGYDFVGFRLVRRPKSKL